jgi:hypothetical protein
LPQGIGIAKPSGHGAHGSQQGVLSEGGVIVESDRLAQGGSKNANGRLRRWLPGQIDIDQVSDEEIQHIVITANLTPRKCLGFKTPFQAILKELGNRFS